MYRPKGNFNVPMKLLVPTWSTVNGVRKKTYPDDGDLIYGSFKTFGGTETTANGVYSIQNTATIECWYRPDIKADCRIVLLQTNETYEIVGDPENIEMRNQFLSLKVQRLGGKS